VGRKKSRDLSSNPNVCTGPTRAWVNNAFDPSALTTLSLSLHGDSYFGDAPLSNFEKEISDSHHAYRETTCRRTCRRTCQQPWTSKSFADLAIQELANRGCPALEHIEVLSGDLTSDPVVALAHACPRLITFRAPRYVYAEDAADTEDSGLGGSAVAALVAACPQLENIDIQGSSITDVSIEALATKGHMLGHIEVSGCRATGTGFAPFALGGCLYDQCRTLLGKPCAVRALAYQRATFVPDAVRAALAVGSPHCVFDGSIIA
jgi:hypothetical protein